MPVISAEEEEVPSSQFTVKEVRLFNPKLVTTPLIITSEPIRLYSPET